MYKPGSLILSAGSFGCNLSCPFCQNYEISMCGAECDTVYLTAEVNREIPLHVTRFFLRWKMTDRPPAKVRTIYELAEAAREILPHVFTGNC